MWKVKPVWERWGKYVNIEKSFKWLWEIFGSFEIVLEIMRLFGLYLNFEKVLDKNRKLESWKTLRKCEAVRGNLRQSGKLWEHLVKWENDWECFRRLEIVRYTQRQFDRVYKRQIKRVADTSGNFAFIWANNTSSNWHHLYWFSLMGENTGKYRQIWANTGKCMLM